MLDDDCGRAAQSDLDHAIVRRGQHHADLRVSRPGPAGAFVFAGVRRRHRADQPLLVRGARLSRDVRDRPRSADARAHPRCDRRATRSTAAICRSPAARCACSPTMRRARSSRCSAARARGAPPADVRFGDALVVVPGTWLVFDHFTHRVTLIGFARDEREREAVDARLDAYVARLLDQRPTIPGAVRADGPVTASMDEATFLERVAQAKRFIYEGDAYQLQVGIRFSCPLARHGVRLLPADSRAQSVAVHVLRRARRARGVRRLAGVSRAARRAHGARFGRLPGRVRATPIPRPISASPTSCSPTRKSAPST